MKFLSCLALVLLLTACATAPQDPTPVVESATLPRDTGIAHSAARAAARSPLSVIVPASSKNTLTPSLSPISASGTGVSPTENTIGTLRWACGNSSTVSGTACWPTSQGARSVVLLFHSA